MNNLLIGFKKHVFVVLMGVNLALLWSINIEGSIYDDIRRGDIIKVRNRLDAGTNPDMQNKQIGTLYPNQTLLGLASYYGKVNIARLLIDRGANLEKKGQHGLGPLQWAAEGGRSEVAKLLVAKGADVNKGGSLSYAILYHHADVVKVLLEHGASATHNGKSALDFAYLKKNAEIVKLLTPAKTIHEAARDGKLWEVKRFVKLGVNINAKEEQGRTVLHFAATKNHLEIVSYLIACNADIEVEDNDKQTPCLWAVSRGHLKIVEFFVNKKANLNAFSDSTKEHIVHWAAKGGFSSIMKLLIASGVKLELKTKAGQTPLQVAQEKGYTEIVNILKNYPSQIKTIFDCVKNGRLTTLKKWIGTGIPLTIRDKNKHSLLHYVVFKGELSSDIRLKLCQFLVEKGIPLDLRDKDGDMAYHLALRISNDTQMIKYLASEMTKKGISIHQRDGKGCTPLYVATTKNNKEIVKMLVSAGALDKPNLAKNETAWDYAKAHGWTELMNIIEEGVSVSVSGNVTPLVQPVLEVKFSKQSISMPEASSSDSISILSEPTKSSEFFIDVNDIKLGDKLGGGNFGIVYKGTWNRQEVAVKQLLMRNLSDDSQEEFEKEAKVWSKLHHPAICALYGICLPRNPGDLYSMVMAFKGDGSLRKLLKSKIALSWNQRNQLAVDIASALEYLHGKRIVHRDLKSPNVLIEKRDGVYRALLTDFGLAEVKDETETTQINAHQSAGTILWMAPELHRGKGSTKATDIWAYGMVLLELATRKIPFKGARAAVIPNLIKDGDLPNIPEDTPSPISQLIKKCWAMKSNARPSISQVLKLLPDHIDSDESSDDEGLGTIAEARLIRSDG